MPDGFLIITLCLLPCVASGIALYRFAFHGQVIRRLARGKVPPITQSAELTLFTKQIGEAKSAFEFCSFLSFSWLVAGLLLLFFCGSALSLKANFVLYLSYMALLIIQSLAKQREKNLVNQLLHWHPSRQSTDLLVKLQGLQRLHQGLAKSETDEAAATADTSPSVTTEATGTTGNTVTGVQTFDKPAIELMLTNLPPDSARPIRSLAEERTLTRAHQQALNDNTLTVGEPMVAIFKDKEQTLRVLMAKAELVWQPHSDESGKQIAGRVFCAGVNFSGAKIAHFDGLAWPETEVNAFTHAWIATKENAHILLTTLWWLNDDQRIVVYELINPGHPFPVDWLATAASRGSWQ